MAEASKVPASVLGLLDDDDKEGKEAADFVFGEGGDGYDSLVESFMSKYRKLADGYESLKKRISDAEMQVAESAAANAGADAKVKKIGSFRGKADGELSKASAELGDITADLLMMESSAVKVCVIFKESAKLCTKMADNVEAKMKITEKKFKKKLKKMEEAHKAELAELAEAKGADGDGDAGVAEDHAKKMEDMEAEIDAAGKRNAELDALLAAATLKATTVEADLETHKADMAEAVEEIEASTKRIEELEDELDTMNKRNEERWIQLTRGDLPVGGGRGIWLLLE